VLQELAVMSTDYIYSCWATVCRKPIYLSFMPVVLQLCSNVGLSTRSMQRHIPHRRPCGTHSCMFWRGSLCVWG
jgi:hypothetical protein